MLRAPNPDEARQDGSIQARGHVVIGRPGLLWRLSNFSSRCLSLLARRRSLVACASWSLPLVVSPRELPAFYSRGVVSMRSLTVNRPIPPAPPSTAKVRGRPDWFIPGSPWHAYDRGTTKTSSRGRSRGARASSRGTHRAPPPRAPSPSRSCASRQTAPHRCR